MLKADVVAVLEEMGDLLEITEANVFEVMAYRNGAQALEDWFGDLDEAVAEGTLTQIPSIGKGLARVIAELVQTDTSEELVRVRGLVPQGLPALLRVRGLGPKRVRTLWQELGVGSLGDLRRAADDGRVQSLRGFGAKTVQQIVTGLDFLENDRPRSAQAPESRGGAMPRAPKPRGRLWAGMSGYSYPQWKGTFYAEETRSGDFLTEYAKRLATVEINNTFYHFPSAKVVGQWQAQTPATFRFAVKAHRRITHFARLGDTARDLTVDFVERCGALGERLACILFQLPPDFARDDTRLEAFLELLAAGPRYAIEFRHESWFAEEVAAMLRGKNIASVASDSDERGVRRVVTADFVYTRLRRSVYRDEELADWDAWFQAQRAEKRDVLVYLKHDEAGTAPNLLLERWVEARPSAAREILRETLAQPKRPAAKRRRQSG